MTTTSDKELLELAAKAAGYNFEWFGQHFHIAIDDRRFTSWNPLTDDGDALRLAVKLQMTIHIDGNLTDVQTGMEFSTEAHLDDPYAATRRAIVRAAAEIGKTL